WQGDAYADVRSDGQAHAVAGVEAPRAGVGPEFKTPHLLGELAAALTVISVLEDRRLQGPGQGRAVARATGARNGRVQDRPVGKLEPDGYELHGNRHLLGVAEERIAAHHREFVMLAARDDAARKRGQRQERR